MKATEVTAGLAESNGSLLPGLWRDSLHVTCGLTACTPGSAPGPTLGNEYGKTLPFLMLSRFYGWRHIFTQLAVCGQTCFPAFVLYDFVIIYSGSNLCIGGRVCCAWLLCCLLKQHSDLSLMIMMIMLLKVRVALWRSDRMSDLRSRGHELNPWPRYGCDSGQIVGTHVPLLSGSIIWQWWQLGYKQAHHTMH